MFKSACTLILALATLSSAEPVNTNQFGYIKPGMPEATVLLRLGPPDSRTVTKRYLLLTRTATGAVGVEREQVQLVYHGDGYIKTAVILLDNGIVISAEKMK